jgi:hypothetical protein
VTPEALRGVLMGGQFWVLELLFLLFVAATAMALPGLVRALRMPAGWWYAFAGLAFVSLAIVYVVPPATNRIYYDEQIYQHAGQNMADLGRTQICNHGIVEYGQLRCWAAEYNKEPYGYPHLLSVGYRLFGTSAALAHHLNRLLHVMFTAALALLVARWFGDGRAGLFAGLLASALPEQLRWSATAAAEPAAAAFGLVAVLAAAHYSQERTARSLAWLVAASAWAAQMRPESGLVLVVAGAVVLAGGRDAWRSARMAWALVAGAALLVPLVVHLAAVRHDSWGTVGPSFSAAFLPINLAVNGWFYLSDPRFPAWVTGLAIAGLVLGGGSWAKRLVLLGYFLVFWTIFLFFYAGSYNYGADVRYSLTTHAPVLALAGLGVAALTRRVPAGRAAAAPVVACLAIVWASTWRLPYARSVGEEAWAARADVAFAERVARTLPPDALVLTHDPNMFMLWGRNAAQLSMALDASFIQSARLRHGAHVYVHWGFWCNVNDPVQQRVCTDALEKNPGRLVEESRERDYRYAFYRIEP